MKDKKPRVFIGSSKEGLEVAKALKYKLDDVAEAVVWENVFELTRNYLESLLKATGEFDYAILVFRADDEAISRGVVSPVVRGNVIFELGLFLGALGPDRTFIVYDTFGGAKVISDLEGITFAAFDSSAEESIENAVDQVCFLISKEIKKRVGYPSRLLFLASNPVNTARIRFDLEARAIADALRHLEKQRRLIIEQKFALSVDDLSRVLQEHSPHFVHIACPGSDDSIILENSKGDCGAGVPLEVVAKIIGLFEGALRCVVFTSGIAQPVAQDLIENIDCVISLDSQIADESVISFGAAFYEALGNGLDVRHAFDAACLQLEAKGELGKPKLYAKAGAAENLKI